jgi:hypothetical protein
MALKVRPSVAVIHDYEWIAAPDLIPDYSRARTTIGLKILNLSPKIRFSDFHVFQHYVSLKILFSAKSSTS